MVARYGSVDSEMVPGYGSVDAEMVARYGAVITEMVARYGAVDESEEEPNDNADNISEDSLSPWNSSKSILLGNVL